MPAQDEYTDWMHAASAASEGRTGLSGVLMAVAMLAVVIALVV